MTLIQYKGVLAVQPGGTLCLQEERLPTPSEVLLGQEGAGVYPHSPLIDELSEVSVQLWERCLLGGSLTSSDAVHHPISSRFSLSIFAVTAMGSAQ